MKKVIMIPEERYNKMIDSYDKAMEELDQVRGQLQQLETQGNVVELLENGIDLQSVSVLDGIFSDYTNNGQHMKDNRELYPEPLGKVLEWFDSHAELVPEDVGNCLITALAGHEKQWFINGFRYAVGIWKVC